MTLLNLKENDIVEVERVHLPMASLIRVQLPPELRSLDVQASAWAQHHIQQQLSKHFDTLTEGNTIPVEWKDNIVEILIVAVFTITEQSGEQIRVDAVNIRQGGVVREIQLEFVNDTKDTKQGATKESPQDDGSRYLATLQALADVTTFERGSNARRFMQRVTDYLEQADAATPWLQIFEQVLKGEVNMFQLDAEWGTTRQLDLLARKEEVQPMMLKLSTAPDVEQTTATSSSASLQIAYPMIPGGAATEVTERNQVRYLDLWLRHELESEIDEGTRWFAEGLTSVVPSGVLDMFDASELKRLLSGDALDDDALDDLFQHVKYHAPGGEQGQNELRTLFETSMTKFEPKQRQAVFRFVTSLDRVPPGGCGSLSPLFTVEIDTQSRATTDRLPCASTCMNHVLMPKYPDVKTMMDRLRTAGSDGLEYHYEYGGGGGNWSDNDSFEEEKKEEKDDEQIAQEKAENDARVKAYIEENGAKIAEIALKLGVEVNEIVCYRIIF